MRKRQFLPLTLAILGLLAMTKVNSQNYVTPYRVNFSFPLQELCAMDNYPPRNNPRLQSSTPFEDWYSPRIRKKFGAWGPDPRRYPPPANYDQLPPEWKRERVLAVAYNLIGLPYQHHHVPAWDPPRNWPWKEVKYGHNSPGVDCSDFTSWCYNYGLGIKLSTGIVQQGTKTQIEGPGGQGTIDVKTIRNDNGFDTLINTLKTGDLLYIRNNKGKIGHVIMWVGPIGWSPNGTPLVIDSTGPEHKDCNGTPIPIGVELRPFTPDSWYYKNFVHAHRIIRG